MKCQSLFLGKIRNMINMSSAEFAQRAVKVNNTSTHVGHFVPSQINGEKGQRASR